MQSSYAAPRRDGTAAIEDGRTPYYDDPGDDDDNMDNDDDSSRGRRNRDDDDDDDFYDNDRDYNDNERNALTADQEAKNNNNRRRRNDSNDDDDENDYDSRGRDRSNSNNSRNDDDSDDDGDSDHFVNERQERAPPPNNSSSAGPRRQYKYSTANMPRRGNCRKYCCICLLFLLFFAISMGISMLFQMLFFGGDDDTGDASQQPDYAERNPNETAFPKDKMYMDQVCSSGTMDVDRGERCRLACEPQFWTCCNPFDKRKVYNYTSLLEYAAATNQTIPALSEQDFLTTNDNDTANATNVTDPQETALMENCTFGNDLRGCMSYAKCQANSGIIDSAPGTLPVLCGQVGLEQDPGACIELCRHFECCHAELEQDNLSCIGANLDICMDYAPCQNLRLLHKKPEDVRHKLMTAPSDLDRACLWELEECFDTCELATECSNNQSSFFQENFLSCLTYAPCNNVSGTTTNIVVADMFSHVPSPPAELVYACHEVEEAIMEETPETCAQYCEQAACCYQEDPDTNCFHTDPLGCWAWHQHCQTEAELRNSWFRTTYQESIKNGGVQ
jgi:hypothetical protein